MDGSYQWHTMYKTKLLIHLLKPIFSRNTNCFRVGGGCVKVNSVVWYIINCAQDWNLINIYFTHDLQNSVVFDI